MWDLVHNPVLFPSCKFQHLQVSCDLTVTDTNVSIWFLFWTTIQSRYRYWGRKQSDREMSDIILEGNCHKKAVISEHSFQISPTGFCAVVSWIFFISPPPVHKACTLVQPLELWHTTALGALTPDFLSWCRRRLMYGFDLMAIPFLSAMQSSHHYLAAMTHAQAVQGPMLPDLLLPSSLFLIRPVIWPFLYKDCCTQPLNSTKR